MELLFSPMSLIRSAKRIEGINLFTHPIDESYDIAKEVAQEWTDDWEEGDGFGSSDSTYALKDFLDRVIMVESFTQSNDLKTEFSPRLTIIKN